MGPPVLDALIAFFWPGACPACQAPAPDNGLCGTCARLVTMAAGVAPPEALEGVPAFVACRYAGVVRDLVLRMKFGRERHPAGALGAILAEALVRSGVARGADCVVPMPLSRRRLKERGFNQAALLAAVVAESLGLPRLDGLLARPVHRPPQAECDAAERARNVRGVFRAADGAFGRAVLLVDDVITTGHTMAEAASALCGAGARLVIACAVAESGWSEAVPSAATSVRSAGGDTERRGAPGPAVS
jgi:ComF family protein